MRYSFAVLISGVIAASGLAQGTAKKAESADVKDEVARVQGKTLDQWAKEFSIKDPSRREVAIRAVSAFPPEIAVKAIPGILAELRRHGRPIPTDLSVRTTIAVVLGELFASGQKIDPKVQAEAVSLLMPLLRDPQLVMRYRAAQALGSIGTPARGATSDLVAMLKDGNYEMRQVAATALARVSWNPNEGPPLPVLQALYQALGDAAFQVRLAAITSLSVLGPPGEPNLVANYVKSLLPVAEKDPEPALQVWARVAIIRATDNYTSEVLAPLNKLMLHSDPVVRVEALQAGGALGPKARTTVTSMTTCLNDTEPRVVAAALWALGNMGPNASSAMPQIQKLANDPKGNEGIKKLAKDTLDRLNGK